MSQQLPKAPFSDVDRASKPEKLIEMLDAQHAMGFHQAYKQRTFDLLALQAGMSVLDVGCGTGVDALAMARLVGPNGHVMGIDPSQTMIDEARKRGAITNLPVSFAQDDVYHLHFADNSFDRCRSDRTFQHLAEPERALSEMIRVTKPGGILLVVDGDHETRVIDTPYPDVTRRFLQFRNATLQQPDIAHRQYALFKQSGLTNVHVEAMTHITTDFPTINNVMHFDGGIRLAQQSGVVTAEEADAWIAYLYEAQQKGQFFHAVTSFITTGLKSV